MSRAAIPRITTRAILLPLFLATTLSTTAVAQTEGGRPTIGIALSGGGARGLAHIGVLRALEEMRVPIDRIAGTSMGAIVGGLYASGLSPEEIEAVIEDVDWPRLLSEKPPRSALGFRGRTKDRRYSVETEIGLAGGLRLPPALSSGQEIVLLLRRHTLPVAPVKDFSRLPIPFAALATDIETAERVVLEEGDLVEALRASMAFPLVFSPVEHDSRLLVDGGLVDNLPVDLVRASGADVVIAVDAIPQLQTGDAMRSLIAVLGQLTTILSRRGVEGQLARADVAIDAPLEEFGLFDYRRADSIIARGEAATRSYAEQLGPFVLSHEEYEAYRAAHRRRPEPPDRADEVRFHAPGWVDERLLLARVGLAPGDPIEPKRLERAAEQVFAIGEFERVGYDLEAVDGRHAVLVRAHDKPSGGRTLRFGIDLVTDSGGADFRTGLVTFTAAVGFVRSRLGPRAAEWTTEARVGQTLGIRTDFHQPIDFAGRWFVEPFGTIERISQPVFDAGRLLAEYDVARIAGGIAAGREIGQSIELQVGVLGSRIDAGLDPEAPEGVPAPTDSLLPELEEAVGAVEASVVVDRLDDLNLPRKGVFLATRLRSARDALGSDRSYDRLAVEAKGFLSRGLHTGFAALQAGSALGTDLPAHEEFLLGGLLSLSGFAEDELRGGYYGVGRVGYYRRIATVPADRGLYLGTWLEAGSAWRESSEIELDDLRWAGTVVALAETPLGPAYLAYGRSEEDRDRIYVGLGRRL